ncbi:hypothetical protein LTR85_010946 [Meristemomyces frigidus]|nr:hypothetical protein LTR85_010946 [Meristemomyces frigidus]
MYTRSFSAAAKTMKTAKPVMSAFIHNAYVYLRGTASEAVALNTDSDWLTIDTCVERGIDVGARYPEAERLFRRLLDPGNLALGSLVSKARMIDMSSSLPDVAETFIALSKSLSATDEGAAFSQMQFLNTKAIYPVVGNKNSSPFHDLCFIGDTGWAIADRSHLRESFLGVLPLLAFTAEEVEAMSDLLKASGLDGRRLSTLVEGSTRPKGALNFSKACTDDFKYRFPFVKA